MWLAGRPGQGDSEAMDTTRTSSFAPAAALTAASARWSASLPGLLGLHRAPALPAETLLLPRGRAVTLAAGACVLRVESGRVWLTRSGDPDDHFIAAGESFAHDGNGQVVVECDSGAPARLRIRAGAPG